MKHKIFIVGISLAALSLLAFTTSCSEIENGKPSGAFMGRAGLDDYSPTAIQQGTIQQVWWCGQGHNPNDEDQDTDTILYATYNTANNATSQPVVVLGETPGSWDSAYTCNPRVIGGVFTNPLGDGKNYTYAMYYVATASTAGVFNSIGVAFSNDGIQWNKYPQPVIVPFTQTSYGVGQPAVYNSDGKSGIWIFFEDIESTSTGHYETTSTDGIHFTLQGQVTKHGMEDDLLDISWGDMAYDEATGYWYTAFNMPRRDPASTGNVGELGQMGTALYRISGGSLLSGATPWERMATFDTVSTGHEANFLAGFLRDKYGNLNVGKYPTIQIFTSMSNPVTGWDASPAASGQAGGPDNWDIGAVSWTPSDQTIPLNHYQNSQTAEDTTGWTDPKGKFVLKSVVGQLYGGKQNGASVPVYGCKSGTIGYFVSSDVTCGGSVLIGINGFALPTTSQARSGLVPLYSCNTSHHEISGQETCAGKGKGTLIGYATH